MIGLLFGPRALRCLRFAAALGLAWLLAGCAALPELPQQVPTQALADWSATPLGALPTRTATDGSGELSGFHLLPGGGDSFDTRIELARAAQRTIDAQYYVLRDDPTGRAFLRALRDAIPALAEVSIGHALIGEALYAGLDATVKVYLRLLS